jgi:hypothetical protein
MTSLAAKENRMQMFHNGNDYVIAHDAADASRVYEEAIGEKYDADELGDWDVVALDKEITVRSDDEPTRRMTAAGWIAHSGRCHLASMDW